MAEVKACRIVSWGYGSFENWLQRSTVRLETLKEGTEGPYHLRVVGFCHCGVKPTNHLPDKRGGVAFKLDDKLADGATELEGLQDPIWARPDVAKSPRIWRGTSVRHSVVVGIRPRRASKLGCQKG
jgi:hypothetical protein